MNPPVHPRPPADSWPVHHVAGVSLGNAALGLDLICQLLELIHVAAQQRHLCTRPCQRLGKNGAQRAACAGDNDHLAGKIGVQYIFSITSSCYSCIHWLEYNRNGQSLPEHSYYKMGLFYAFSWSTSTISPGCGADAIVQNRKNDRFYLENLLTPSAAKPV